MSTQRVRKIFKTFFKTKWDIFLLRERERERERVVVKTEELNKNKFVGALKTVIFIHKTQYWFIKLYWNINEPQLIQLSNEKKEFLQLGWKKQKIFEGWHTQNQKESFFISKNSIETKTVLAIVAGFLKNSFVIKNFVKVFWQMKS